MKKQLVMAVVFACGLGAAACDGSPSSPDVRPQFDGRRRTTTTTSSDTTAVTNSGGQIGDPCDPETYTGPYHCVPDPNHDSGYIIAY